MVLAQPLGSQQAHRSHPSGANISPPAMYCPVAQYGITEPSQMPLGENILKPSSSPRLTSSSLKGSREEGP